MEINANREIRTINTKKSVTETKKVFIADGKAGRSDTHRYPKTRRTNMRVF